MSRADLLLKMQEATYERLIRRLQGIHAEEFSWKPVAEAWTVFEDDAGRWTYDYGIPDPVPAPVTTIAWQVIHLGTCKVMYHEWAFGPARLTFPEIDIPHTPATAVALLEEGQKLLRADLEGLTEAGLDEQVRTNWGELWPAWQIFSVMADHDSFHGGMIGALRDLYQWRAG